MKRKELKNLAQKLAKLEIAAQNASTSKEKASIEDEMLKLSGHLKGIEDMIAVDEMVQEILSKDFEKNS